jgi:hypothetical protein
MVDGVGGALSAQLDRHSRRRRGRRRSNLLGIVDGTGVAAPTVHHDGRGRRLAVAKSLLNGSRAVLPP